MKRGAAFLILALLAAFTFGILVLAGGDWLPGGIIVAASAVGLAQQIRQRGRGGPRPSPPKSVG